MLTIPARELIFVARVSAFIMNTIALIISSYNQLAYIQKAVGSAIKQTIPFHQIVVVDDGSVDGSAEYLQQWQTAHDNVKVVARKQNGGRSATRISGLQVADGNYVAFLDGDDVIMSCANEKMLELLGTAQPDIGLFNMLTMDEFGQAAPDKNDTEDLFTEDGLEGKFHQREMSPPTDDQLKRLIWRHPAIWMKTHRTQFLLENELVLSGKIYEDLTWHFKTLLLAKSINYSPVRLIKYRIHPDSIIQTVTALHMELFDRYIEIENFLIVLDVSPTIRREFRRHRFTHLTHTLLAADLIPDRLKSNYIENMFALPDIFDFDMNEVECATQARLKRLRAEI